MLLDRRPTVKQVSICFYLYRFISFVQCQATRSFDFLKLSLYYESLRMISFDPPHVPAPTRKVLYAFNSKQGFAT